MKCAMGTRFAKVAAYHEDTKSRRYTKCFKVQIFVTLRDLEIKTVRPRHAIDRPGELSSKARIRANVGVRAGRVSTCMTRPWKIALETPNWTIMAAGQYYNAGGDRRLSRQEERDADKVIRGGCRYWDHGGRRTAGGASCICSGIRHQAVGHAAWNGHENGVDQSPLMDCDGRERRGRRGHELGDRMRSAEQSVETRLQQGNDTARNRDRRRGVPREGRAPGGQRPGRHLR